MAAQTYNVDFPKKRPPVRAAGDLCIMVYGFPGVGKTTFASKAKDALFFSFERGADHLEVASKLITDWGHFRAMCAKLAATPDHGFKTIVIDTADAAYDMCKAYICNQLGIAHPSDAGDNAKGYDSINLEFQRVFSKLNSMGLGLVFLSHANNRSVKDRQGQKQDRIVPALTGKTGNWLAGFCSVIGYAEVQVVPGEKGEAKQVRRLNLVPSVAYDAKIRLPLNQSVPDSIDLDWDALQKLLGGGK